MDRRNYRDPSIKDFELDKYKHVVHKNTLLQPTNIELKTKKSELTLKREKHSRRV